MTPIPSTKHYYTDGKDIFRRLKDGRMRPLRECKNRCYTLSVRRKRITATKAKFIWCADHQIAPTDIDAKFAFVLRDGVSEVIMFADKMVSVSGDFTGIIYRCPNYTGQYENKKKEL